MVEIGPHLWGEIFQYLSHNQVIFGIRFVCQRFRDITEGTEFWGRVRKFEFNGEKIKSHRLIGKIFRNLSAIESMHISTISEAQSELVINLAFGNNNLDGDDDEEVQAPMKKMRKRLMSIDISKASIISNDNSIMHLIAENSPQLSRANFSNCEHFDPTILSSCKNLKSLDLSNCKMMNNNILSSIANNLWLLERLNLESCDRVDDQGMIELTMACLNLREIIISFCRKLTNLSINALFKMTKLESIQARYCHISDAVFTEMSQHDYLVNESIKYLDLKACSAITDDSCISIGSKFVNLQEIDLSLCPLITLNGIENITRRNTSVSSSLKNVHITGCRISNEEHFLLQNQYPSINFALEKNQKLRMVLDLLSRGWSLFRSQAVTE
jgi:hypothetical protein